jgi:HEAT repeat protein
LVRGKLVIKAGQPIPELFPYQAERDELIRLASTYDPKNIATIAESLNHADATVREAARQALIQIGDPAAIPHLRAASKSARVPEEAQSIKEIIEFLSLPHISDILTLSANAAHSQTP